VQTKRRLTCIRSRLSGAQFPEAVLSESTSCRWAFNNCPHIAHFFAEDEAERAQTPTNESTATVSMHQPVTALGQCVFHSYHTLGFWTRPLRETFAAARASSTGTCVEIGKSLPQGDMATTRKYGDSRSEVLMYSGARVVRPAAGQL
jgi:hypothetical protein